MRTKTLEVRVEFLESTVGGLVDVPRQIHALSAQILQVRGEVREGISAVRGETREMGDVLRDEINQMADTLRGEMHEQGDTFRAEIRKSEANLTTQMRVLHEEVLERIATMGEATAPVKGSRTRTSKL